MPAKISFLILSLTIAIFPGVLFSGQKKYKINYRDEMRDFVISISQKSKSLNKKFLIIPQNALTLLTKNGKANGKIIHNYLNALDGVGCEELFYGYPEDGSITPHPMTKDFLNFLFKFKKFNKKVLVIDYTINPIQRMDSYERNKRFGFLSFQAERSLSIIHPQKNYQKVIKSNAFSEAKNFLYLINPKNYKNKRKYIQDLSSSNYDLIIMDAFFNDKILSKQEIYQIKQKSRQKQRLVISYLSIGEAEKYRYYWKKKWRQDPPEFLEKENPDWTGNFKVKYWLPQWQKIICGLGNGKGFNESYLKKILDAGFDGVYLDIVDAAFYFEDKNE